MKIYIFWFIAVIALIINVYNLLNPNEVIIEKEVQVVRYATEFKEVMRTKKYYDCMENNWEYSFRAWSYWVGVDHEELCTY